MPGALSEKVYQMLTTEDEGRVCLEIEDKSCREQPQNFVRHLVSLAFTKSADGMLDPKLVLAWLMAAYGVPAYFIGLLVPIREAGALLPQLFIANYIRTREKRKYVWALGSLVQGTCAVLMGVSFFLFDAIALGISLAILLAILAIARSFCSIAIKDVLGKTIDKARRGTCTGAATSLAASSVILYALLLSSGLFDKMTLVMGGVFLAGFLWLLACLTFLGLNEDAGATSGGGNPITIVKENMQALIADRQLVLFVAVRALLTATALAPPFMMALSAQNMESGFADLGFMVLASAFAALISGYIWGRLSDLSSRKVLMFSGVMSGCTLALTLGLSAAETLNNSWVMPCMLFGLMVGYQGVRLGRATHLVDMAGKEQRALYTALSNTIIGVLLLFGGIFGVIGSLFGVSVVLLIFCAMSFGAALLALGLEEVQKIIP